NFAFQSSTTSQFIDYLKSNLLREEPHGSEALPLEHWLHGAGLPEGAALPISDALEQVENQAACWLQGQISLKDLPTSSWSTQEWLHFSGMLPPQWMPPACKSSTGNST